MEQPNLTEEQLNEVEEKLRTSLMTMVAHFSVEPATWVHFARKMASNRVDAMDDRELSLMLQCAKLGLGVVTVHARDRKLGI